MRPRGIVDKLNEQLGAKDTRIAGVPQGAAAMTAKGDGGATAGAMRWWDGGHGMRTATEAGGSGAITYFVRHVLEAFACLSRVCVCLWSGQWAGSVSPEACT